MGLVRCCEVAAKEASGELESTEVGASLCPIDLPRVVDSDFKPDRLTSPPTC